MSSSSTLRCVWRCLAAEGWQNGIMILRNESLAVGGAVAPRHALQYRGIASGGAPSTRTYSTNSSEAGNGADNEKQAAAAGTEGEARRAAKPRASARPGTKPGDHPRQSHQRSRKTAMSKSLQSAQERVAELLTPGKDTLLMHEDSSYELIGRAEDAPKVVAGASARAAEISPQRIHPHRLFYPGAKYSPEELNPYKAKAVLMRSDLTVQRGSIPKDVVSDQADFRNTSFLTYFLKDSGKLVSRRRTALPAKLHRELMREIKLARSLALMDPMSKSTVDRTRSKEELEEGRARRSY